MGGTQLWGLAKGATRRCRPRPSSSSTPSGLLATVMRCHGDEREGGSQRRTAIHPDMYTLSSPFAVRGGLGVRVAANHRFPGSCAVACLHTSPMPDKPRSTRCLMGPVPVNASKTMTGRCPTVVRHSLASTDGDVGALLSSRKYTACRSTAQPTASTTGFCRDPSTVRSNIPTHGTGRKSVIVRPGA